MLKIRRSVYENGGTFANPTLFWYAIGVRELQKRGLDSVVSWRFMAAIHGIHPGLWAHYGYLQQGEPLPSSADQQLYWEQCQHGSWYFLPWHRGYIWSIEAILREAIVDQDGPDDWAMPYWDYSDASEPQARVLPPAFSRPDMPDGSPNALFVSERFGRGSTPIRIPSRDVSLQALASTRFTAQGQFRGFGGGKTGFSNSGRDGGTLESLPHNPVHVDIGGQNQNGPGLMSDPATAALDPIFWAHHANIDRLWSVWNKQGRSNPTDAAWLSGPMNRQFVVPNTDGSEFNFMPSDMLDTQALPLEYEYDHLHAAAQANAAPVTRGATRSRGVEATVADSKPASLIGANEASLAITGGRSRSRVQLESAPMDSVVRGRSAALSRPTRGAPIAAADPAPRQHVMLNLENIRAKQDGYIIDVYVDLPEDADPREREDLFAGSVALFGARQASDPDQPHAGMGLSEVFDITNIVENLADDDGFDPSAISVELVPRSDVEGADISVERISVYLQEEAEE